MKKVWTLLTDTANDFLTHDCQSLAAALAYYTVFALPPLLVLVMTIVGLVWDPRQVEGQVGQQMAELVGQQGAGQIQTMVGEARHFGSGLAATLGVMVLIVGATGLFAQLQWSLNRVWEVQPDPAQGGLKNFMVKRILSFGMILAIAFLLLVSLIVSAILSAFGQYIANLLSGQISQTFLQVANFTISLVVIAVLFAAMFRWLPDARTAWKDVIFGAIVTTLLFLLGRTLIGLYLGNTNIGSAYGAAGSLVLVLIWIYYSSIILLLGAEFTHVWARHHGNVEPVEGAVRVEQRTIRAGSQT
jgi:membrane protein